MKRKSQKQSFNTTDYSTAFIVEEDPDQTYMKPTGQKASRPWTSRSLTTKFYPYQNKRNSSIFKGLQAQQKRQKRQKYDPNLQKDYDLQKYDGVNISSQYSKGVQQAKHQIKDQRKRVNKLQYPYSSIARIVVEFPPTQILNQNTKQIQQRENISQGTVVFISPTVALTCAHNLYSSETNEQAKNVRLFKDIQVNGKIQKVQLKVHNWKIKKQFKNLNNHHRIRYDIGLIVLEQNSIISKDQCLEIKWDYSYWKNPYSQIKIIGYHSKYQSVFLNKQLYEQDKAVLFQRDVFLDHIHTTEKGYSGTAVLIKEKGSDIYKIIAIHRGTRGEKNQALLINSLSNTSQIINQLAEQLSIQQELNKNYVISKLKLNKQNKELHKINSKLSKKHEELKQSIKEEQNPKIILQNERKQKQFYRNQCIQKQVQIKILQNQMSDRLNQIGLLNQKIIALQLQDKRLNQEIKQQKSNSQKIRLSCQKKEQIKENNIKLEQISNVNSLLQYQSKLSQSQIPDKNLHPEVKQKDKKIKQENIDESFQQQQVIKQDQIKQKDIQNLQKFERHQNYKNDSEAKTNISKKQEQNYQCTQINIEIKNKDGCIQSIKKKIKKLINRIFQEQQKPQIQPQVPQQASQVKISVLQQQQQLVQQPPVQSKQVLIPSKYQFIKAIEKKGGKIQKVGFDPYYRKLSLKKIKRFSIQSFIKYDWKQLKQLNLGQCQLYTRDWKKLAQNGKKFQNLQILIIYDNKIQKVQLHELQKFPKIREIYFKKGIYPGNRLDEQSISNIQKFKNKNYNIKKGFIICH